jgi:2-polyprenyl-6-hydroxyphenyl methylase/3-demethylubiquinone-9 3-methyltransferase
VFLEAKVKRDLVGVQLAISDAHAGLKAAIAKVLGCSWAALHRPLSPRLPRHARRDEHGLLAALIRPISTPTHSRKRAIDYLRRSRTSMSRVRSISMPAQRLFRRTLSRTSLASVRAMNEASRLDDFPREVAEGERFEFGRNWTRFLEVLDDRRIAEAETSLRRMLDTDDLLGVRFLDVGSGSGLFSLAAARLGAQTVRSFDYDPNSVACTRELRRRYGPDSTEWTVELGSALDATYIRSLGRFDVVYSWGVLHHTGDMWNALANATEAVAPGGRLFISVYNDQGLRSHLWRTAKRWYNRLPPGWRLPYAVFIMGPREIVTLLKSVARGRPLDSVRGWTDYKSARGMSRWHDLIDWIGGYPFQVATPEAVFDFVASRGFTLERLKTCGGGLGCNEFVFRRAHAAP